MITCPIEFEWFDLIEMILEQSGISHVYLINGFGIKYRSDNKGEANIKAMFVYEYKLILW